MLTNSNEKKYRWGSNGRITLLITVATALPAIRPRAEWREVKDILGEVSRFPEVGEASSPYFLGVSVLCPAGAPGLSPGIVPELNQSSDGDWQFIHLRDSMP